MADTSTNQDNKTFSFFFYFNNSLRLDYTEAPL